jgi:hypothetical protein
MIPQASLTRVVRHFPKASDLYLRNRNSLSISMFFGSRFSLFISLFIHYVIRRKLVQGHRASHTDIKADYPLWRSSLVPHKIRLWNTEPLRKLQIHQRDSDFVVGQRVRHTDINAKSDRAI